MSSNEPLLDYDVGYYEYLPGLWLPGKVSGPQAFASVSRRAVDAAKDMPLSDSDVLLASYPKTGVCQKYFYRIRSNNGPRYNGPNFEGVPKENLQDLKF